MAEVTAEKPVKVKPLRGRVRRVAKWVGFFASIAIVLLAAWSIDGGYWWWQTGAVEPRHYWEHSVALQTGTVEWRSVTSWCAHIELVDDSWLAVPQWRLVPELGYRSVLMPLWLPFVLVAGPTCVLWYRDRAAVRRRRAGECVKCGYNRRGLVDGAACPECGAGAR